MPHSKPTPDSLQGLEEAAERVLSGEEKLLDCFRELLTHAKIRADYQRMKRDRGWGASGEIIRELSEKYFNTPHRERHIKRILYRKY